MIGQSIESSDVQRLNQAILAAMDALRRSGGGQRIGQPFGRPQPFGGAPQQTGLATEPNIDIVRERVQEAIREHLLEALRDRLHVVFKDRVREVIRCS